jgi:hypothetical protein
MTKALITVAPEHIPYLREDKLRKEMFNLESKKNALLRNNDRNPEKFDAINRIELEVCYLQRELEIRVARKNAHSEFLQKRSKRSYSHDNRARGH